MELQSASSTRQCVHKIPKTQGRFESYKLKIRVKHLKDISLVKAQNQTFESGKFGQIG